MGLLDPPGLSKAVADATYATPTYGRYAPTMAGARAGQYDHARGLYNAKASNMTKIRAQIGKVLGASASCKIGIMGDSLMAGRVATPGLNDPGQILRNLFASSGYPPAGGYVWAWNNTAVDTRWAWSGSGTAWTAGAGAAPFVPYISATTAGKIATYTSTNPGTVVDILTYGDTAPFTVSIDGGAATAITGLAGTTAPQVIRVASGLADTTHTVTITSVAGTNKLAAVNVSRTTAGVHVSNAAISGLRSATARGANHSPMMTLMYSVPDIVIIEMGMNELLSGISMAQYKTDLTALANDALTQSAAVLLVASNPVRTSSAVSGTTYTTAQVAALRSATYDVADALDLPLLDFGDRIADYDAAQAVGLTSSDGVHLGPAGYALKARMLYDALVR